MTPSVRQIFVIVLTLATFMAGCSEPASDSDSPPLLSDAPPQQGQPTVKSGQMNAAHILIMHRDSERVPPEIKRTKAEAEELAKKLAADARKDGADFAALAAKFSDGPSKTKGGNLGNFSYGQMVPEFSAATEKLGVGDISDPVETGFGFHIILRKAVE